MQDPVGGHQISDTKDSPEVPVLAIEDLETNPKSAREDPQRVVIGLDGARRTT